MNKETVQGQFDQATGKIKQKVGEAVGNENLANSGVADQVKGAAKESWGRTKEAAHETAENVRANTETERASLSDRAKAEAHHLREEISSATQNVKDKFNQKMDDIKRNQQRNDS